jgi:type IV fimbrial biogenesis protein FimT
MRNLQRRQRGITLTELMVTISIAALSLSLGVPAFEQVRVRSDRSAAIIELVSAATRARSEAAVGGSPVSLCASTDGITCSGALDWSRGWIVFHDPDENLAIADQADVITVVRFENARFTITADANIGPGITFGLFGFASPATGQLTYIDAAASRTVQLSYIGRLNVVEPTT